MLKFLLPMVFVFIDTSFAATEFGAMLGVSSSNVQVPERIYNQGSLHFGSEVTFDSAAHLRTGAFWEANNLVARAGKPVPFQAGGNVSGLSHFFGILLRFSPLQDSRFFFDMKVGVNQRSVGAPPPVSDLSPGLGVAMGYRFQVAENFSIGPRIGYRILSYSVQQASHYAHQGYDLNVLASISF